MEKLLIKLKERFRNAPQRNATLIIQDLIDILEEIQQEELVEEQKQIDNMKDYYNDINNHQ